MSQEESMLRRSLALAATLAAAGFFASAPAQAEWRVIKWNTTNVCQLWYFGLDGNPFPSDYKVVSKPMPDFATAWAAKSALFQKAHCAL
jgi:hypothetical protein